MVDIGDGDVEHTLHFQPQGEWRIRNLKSKLKSRLNSLNRWHPEHVHRVVSEMDLMDAFGCSIPNEYPLWPFAFKTIRSRRRLLGGTGNGDNQNGAGDGDDFISAHLVMLAVSQMACKLTERARADGKKGLISGRMLFLAQIVADMQYMLRASGHYVGSQTSKSKYKRLKTQVYQWRDQRKIDKERNVRAGQHTDFIAKNAYCCLQKMHIDAISNERKLRYGLVPVPSENWQVFVQHFREWRSRQEKVPKDEQTKLYQAVRLMLNYFKEKVYQ